MREIPYPTPGEILLEEFLSPMGLTQYRLAKEIGVSQRRIGEIVAGKHGCGRYVKMDVGGAGRVVGVRPRDERGPSRDAPQ